MDSGPDSKPQLPAQKFAFIEDGNHSSGDGHINKEGYGKFHYMFLLMLIPVGCSMLFSSGSLSYVLPIAECELHLSDFDKGILNAGVYAGMIMASFFWGFASDIFGRRKLLVAGFFMDATFNMLTSVANSVWLILLLKILNGTAITGPNALMYSYLAEVHDNAHRPTVIMITGGLIALAQVIQPAMAYLVIPLKFRFELIPGVLEFSSWRLFLVLSSLPSYISCISFLSVPESPKFLMSKGRTDEALASFKRIYAMNTGKPGETYPIKELQAPPKQASSAAMASSPSSGGVLAIIRAGWIQVRPIFRPPYLNIALLVFSIQILLMLCLNSLRLWVPQLFATLDEATTLALNSTSSESTGTLTVCDLISSVDSPSAAQFGDGERICLPVKGEVYLRALIIGLATTLSFLVSTTAVRCVGKKTIAQICFPLAAAAAASMNWATDSDMFMGMNAMYTAMMGNALTAMNSLTVDLFPTAFRSMALSLTMMCGRIASLCGNIVFPVLLNLSCNAVFFSIGGVLAMAAILVWFIPNRTEAR